jgi:HEAT repeat protein
MGGGARAKTIERWVEKLRTVGDLRQALALNEWLFQRFQGEETPDDKFRQKISNRLQEELEKQAKDPNRRLAVAICIGGIPNNPSPDPKDRGGFARSLAKILINLVGKDEKDPKVRAAAARSLGKINAPGKDVVPVLKRILKDEKKAAVRAAAAEGLRDLMQGIVREMKRGRGGFAETSPKGSLETAKAVIEAAMVGLAGRGSDVRCRCAEAVQQAANLLGGLAQPFPVEFRRGERPEGGNRLQGIRSAAKALGDIVPVLARALKKGDQAVCIAVARALEAVGQARRQLLQSSSRAARGFQGGEKAKEPEDLLGKKLAAAAPALASRLKEKEVRIRLGCLYALEAMDRQAVKAVKEVAQALKDNNHYVRWAAVRSLGRMAPLNDAKMAGKVVDGLIPLLKEKNQYVKITTLAALERYGPAAKIAVVPLAKAVERGNSEVQVWAIRALVAVGTDAKPSVPSLIKALLSGPKAKVRLAAANALARFGAPSEDVEKALRKALADADSEVRQAASEALLVK